MSFMIAAEITGVVLAACRGFGPEVSNEVLVFDEQLDNGFPVDSMQ